MTKLDVALHGTVEQGEAAPLKTDTLTKVKEDQNLSLASSVETFATSPPHPLHPQTLADPLVWEEEASPDSVDSAQVAY